MSQAYKTEPCLTKNEEYKREEKTSRELQRKTKEISVNKKTKMK